MSAVLLGDFRTGCGKKVHYSWQKTPPVLSKRGPEWLRAGLHPCTIVG
ncbi:hypothetical protein T4D_17011 [Trichinella pseudospiralis]|uniref:Uncharacterized protein n=1 Tax=Trichinella pseudospiralis TaxID=6337 RepID=A0A0V1DPI5_TRIPS|nr:hypothetical protein T4D_17011 [Trichinella pseudospiralis]